MNRKIYKTAQGAQIDIDQLRLLNEGVVAVGNMSVNARGDQVNPDGSIKTTRNEIMKNTYRTNAVVAGKGKVSSTSSNTKVANTVAPSERPAKPSPVPKPTTKPSDTTQSVETTPTIMRGSLANAIIGADPMTDLTSTSTTTRTIKRI